MPALSEIQEDIPLLANYFLNKYCLEMKKEPKKLAPGALRCLMSYPWPGNVRELENEMKRLVVLIPPRVITEEDFPESLQSRGVVYKSSTSAPVERNGRGVRKASNSRDTTNLLLQSTAGSKSFGTQSLGFNQEDETI